MLNSRYDKNTLNCPMIMLLIIPLHYDSPLLQNQGTPYTTKGKREREREISENSLLPTARGGD